MAEDVVLGSASLQLGSVLSNFTGSSSQRSWAGWIPLTWRPEETQDGSVMAGAAAGAMIAGPPGALVGGLIGNFIKKGVQGQVYVELTYTPMNVATPPDQIVKEKDLRKVLKKYESILPKAAKPQVGSLVTKTAPRGATEGIDWSELSLRVGKKGQVDAEDYETCCFIQHNATSTEVGIWRDLTRRKVIIAFRGTSDPRDMITDVSLLQTPWEGRADGNREAREKEDPRQASMVCGVRRVV